MIIILFVILFGSLSGVYYTMKFLKARPSLSRLFWFVVIPFIFILSPLFLFIAIKQVLYGWYYRNRPAPLPHSIRRLQHKDIIIFKGKTMSLAKYNKQYGKNVKLEDVYGKKYVESLTEEEIASFDKDV